MKFIVISPFKDKYSEKYYKIGEIVDFEEKRSKEILKSGEFIKKKESKKTPSKPED